MNHQRYLLYWLQRDSLCYAVCHTQTTMRRMWVCGWEIIKYDRQTQRASWMLVPQCTSIVRRSVYPKPAIIKRTKPLEIDRNVVHVVHARLVDVFLWLKGQRSRSQSLRQ